MKSMKEVQQRSSKPEKGGMFKEMHDYVMDGIEVWQRMLRLGTLRENCPELYDKQRTDLLSKKNLHYVINIASGTCDDDLRIRKEAIMLLRGIDDTEARLELTAIMDNGLEDRSIRMEASKALIWDTLQ